MHSSHLHHGEVVDGRRLMLWRIGAVTWGLLYVALTGGSASLALSLAERDAQLALAAAVAAVALLDAAVVVVWFLHVAQPATRSVYRTAIARTHAVGIALAAVGLATGIDPLRWLAQAMLLIYLVGLFAAFARPVPEVEPFARAIHFDPAANRDVHHHLPAQRPDADTDKDQPPVPDAGDAHDGPRDATNATNGTM